MTGWDYDTLQGLAKGNVCAKCHQYFEVAWKDGAYKLRCDCGYHDDPPAMERVRGPYERVRAGEEVGDYIITGNIRRVMRQNREMQELKKELEKEGIGK